MFGKVNSIYLQGMWGTQVSVEADVSGGLPGYSFVGYLASEVREAQDRVRTAIRNLGVELPPRKVTINLSPADLRKEGTGFDLAIAAAILTAYGIIPAPEETWLFLGELGLDGRIKGIPGALTLTVRARELGFTRLFLPEENLKEASMIQGIGLVGAGSLMYASSDRKAFARRMLLKHIEKEVKKRKKIVMPSDEEMKICLRTVLEELADSEEMQAEMV